MAESIVVRRLKVGHKATLIAAQLIVLSHLGAAAPPVRAETSGVAAASLVSEPVANDSGAKESLAEPIAGSQSARNANYRIEATLDPASKKIDGRQTLRWTNLQEAPTEELWFHLYWNGWRNNRSTWMLEDRIRGRSDRGEDVSLDDWSYLEIDSVQFEGIDLTAALQYRSPDDGNPDDRTVVRLALPREIASGETIEVDMTWRSKVPRTFARTGYRGNYFFIAHWFPKLGVYEADGWNRHQFHSGTEFFSDYGIYDVTLTLPTEFVVGATGRRVALDETSDGLSTHHYRQEDVHGFAWTASPDYLVYEDRFEAEGLPPVDLRLLLQPEHEAQAQRHFDATRVALEKYGRWYGPYPYALLTIVDPAYGSGAGGMEYPTLFTSGTRLFNPFGIGSPEGVTLHEAGHQFWYGLVGNNEFEHAWLDEGLNTFSTGRAEAEAYGEPLTSHRFFKPPHTDQRAFFPVFLPEINYGGRPHADRTARYRKDAKSDRQSTPTYLYHPRSASSLSYSKTALWLATLENYLGWETLQVILSTFFERYRFGHPTPQNFIDVAEEVTNSRSGPEVRQLLHDFLSSVDYDYGIQSVSSKLAQTTGWRHSDDGSLQQVDGDSGSSERYRTEVIVRRYGDGVFPIDVLLRFEDGSEARHAWDGKERWIRLVEERPSRLESALVDPDLVLLLDTHVTNNSLARSPDHRLPVTKWSSRWLVWFQDALSTFASYL